MAAFSRKMITVGVRNFVDKAVGTQKTELPGDAGRTASFFLRGIGRSVVENGLKVAVTEPVKGKFAAGDGLKEIHVLLVPRFKSANGLIPPVGGLAERAQKTAQRGGGINSGEGVEVTLIGRL